MSYEDKIKPHTHRDGGPLTPLLESGEIEMAMVTKCIDKIANSFNHATWMNFMVEQIMLVAHTTGIYSLDHALMCDLNIKRVASISKKDPFTARALQYLV